LLIILVGDDKQLALLQQSPNASTLESEQLLLPTVHATPNGVLGGAFVDRVQKALRLTLNQSNTVSLDSALGKLHTDVVGGNGEQPVLVYIQEVHADTITTMQRRLDDAGEKESSFLKVRAVRLNETGNLSTDATTIHPSQGFALMKPKAPSTCQVCESVVMMAHIYAEYENLNSTTLEGQLSQVCALLPMNYQAQCQVMIAAFGMEECECVCTPTAKFNATLCCTDIAICTNLDYALAAKPTQCEVCESVATTANIIARYEGWNATEIQAKLALVCGFVPMQYQMECQTLIQSFGKIEAECIADPKFNAQLCCSDVGVCPMPPLPAPRLSALKPKADDYCNPCKTVATAVHYIVEVAGINGTLLDKDLQAICSYVPVEYQAECENVLYIGGSEVADCVANATVFDSQTCCYEAGLCSTPSKLARALSKK